MLFNMVIRCVASATLAAALSGCAPSRGIPAADVAPTKVAFEPGSKDASLDVEAEPPSEATPRSKAVPTAAEIFDFHPPGSRAGSWREPFIVSYTEGPLNAYRLKTLEELRVLRDHKNDVVPSPALAEN